MGRSERAVLGDLEFKGERLPLPRRREVPEGSVGAGTGMMGYRHKGGNGNSSRLLPPKEGGYTLGVLVNCNIGRQKLVLAGVPVGEELALSQATGDRVEDLENTLPEGLREGSIIVVLATDAPLLPGQLNRLAKRAALGIPRTGSPVHHGSGDFVIAFSTAARVPHDPDSLTMPLVAVHNTHLDPLFVAAVEATEEAIGNALTMATTTVGRDGHKGQALPLDKLVAIMRKYGRLRGAP